jgi:2-hydroxychromene-2-carboxylate isomerase
MDRTAYWYFDFVSPFAYLQLQAMPALRERLEITPRPVLLGAILGHHGQLGPAEIPGKREFTYRFAQWRADRDGIPLRFPPAHPFNPLAALRLCIAAGSGWDAVGALFDHLWREGRSGTTAGELAEVGRALGIADVAAAIAADEVKAALRANTEEALAAGVYGVPTVRVGAELFWGSDATPMLHAFLDDPALFRSPDYRRLAQLPEAASRPR